MTTTASFAAPTLTVLGDTANNTITINRGVGGAILVNGGDVPITGGFPSVANTSLIAVLAGAGDDTVILDQANGALPAANLNGKAGNDTLTGGARNDEIFGGRGNDVLSGQGGNDTLFGGAGNDTMTASDGDDSVNGGAGDDRFIWNPGDDSDLFEGGDGIDTVEVNAGAGAEILSITADGTRVRFDRLDPAPFAINIGATEELLLNANAGADQVLVDPLTGTDLKRITVNLAKPDGNGDLAVDRVTINAGMGNDHLSLATVASAAAMFTVAGAEMTDVIGVNGMGGSDTIAVGRFAHALAIDGGTERDTVSYAQAIVGLTANLTDPSFNAGAAAGHTYVSVESLIGSAFQDLLTGNADANTLDGGAGADVLTGLGGDDFYRVDNAGDVVEETAGNGVDHVRTRISLALSSSADIEVLSTTVASKAAINLTGNGLSQSIIGNSGANKLKGKAGDDALFGNRGNDILDGGVGKDSFVFDTRPNASNVDIIKNYVRADDTIILDNDVFGALATTGRLAKSAFHASTSGRAHDSNDRILYESDTGRVFYDRDGTGNAQAIHFATLSGHPTIGANDFFIV